MFAKAHIEKIRYLPRGGKEAPQGHFIMAGGEAPRSPEEGLLFAGDFKGEAKRNTSHHFEGGRGGFWTPSRVRTHRKLQGFTTQPR